MKNDRTRAGRKAARRYNVSPVARAVRGVLSLSAVALLFSGTGAALAKSPAAIAPVPTAERARLTHEFAPVMDLTRIGDEWTPKSVVDEGFEAFASGFGGGDAMFASSEGDTGYMAAVADLTTLLPGTYHAGPGGVSGAANVVGISFDFSGQPAPLPFWGTRSDTATDGFATSVFVTSSTDVVLGTQGTVIDTTGQTWAAAWEIEGAGDVTFNHDATSTATATVTGDDGAAFALYVNGGTSATINNSGTLTATGTGAYSYATGMLAMSIDGDAAVHNAGTITATSYVAIGAHAYSIYGDATATNAAGDTITAKGDGAAVGLWAYSYYGTATVDNAGTIDSSGNIARGAWADGAYAVGINSGTIGAYGDAEAIGMQASGFYSADINNTGAIIASATGDAFGLHSQALGDASVTNGIGASVTATAVDGDAYGALVIGQYYSANATNFGTIDATGGGFAAGVAVIGGTNANVINEGAIDATANGFEGFAVGAIAIGGDVMVDNDGRITANGFFATGVDVRAGGNVSVDNAYMIDASGFDATGISASSTGEGAHVGVVNVGTVYASSDSSAYGGFATGVAAVARGYLGSAEVDNAYGRILVDAKYGDANGVVVSTDMDAAVHNTGMIGAIGGTSAYAVLALSADGDITVDNAGTLDMFGGILAVATDGREGTAYGIAAQSNNGLLQITNNGDVYAVGVAQATGIYAATKWNDANVANNGHIMAAGKYGNATGAIAISYTGAANVVNAYGALAEINAANNAGGMRAISLYGDANVTNDGDIVVQAGNLARGATTRALYGGDALITNTGTIDVDGTMSAYGAWSRADYYGTAAVDNQGAIVATSQGYVDGYGAVFGGVAYGVLAGGDYGATVGNTGTIDVTARSFGAGIVAYSGYGAVDVGNDGAIDVHVYDGTAIGMIAESNNGGIIRNGVDGTINATADSGAAIGMLASGDSIWMINDGVIHASGQSNAIGMAAYGDVNGMSISTSGDVYATVTSKYGSAIGLYAQAKGDVDVRNYGTVHATNGGNVYGVIGASTEGGVFVMNDGAIYAATSIFGDSATGILGYATGSVGINSYGSIDVSGKYAVGISAASLGDSVNVRNDGDINVSSHGVYGAGILAHSATSFAAVRNTGDVVVGSDNDFVMGIAAIAGEGEAYIDNVGGLVQVASVNGSANGVYAGGRLVNVSNYGDIVVDGALYAVGIGFDAAEGGSITNDGTITVTQHGAPQAPQPLTVEDGNAFGIVGETASGLLTVTNDGLIDVTALDNATGIAVRGDGDITVNGSGDMIVSATNGNAAGISVAGNVVDAHNGGDMDVIGHDFARGILASGETTTVSNDGTIDVATNFQFGNVYGIQAAGTTSVDVSNAGAITAVATDDYAHGIDAYSLGSIAIDNSGSIDVAANPVAFGISVFAAGNVDIDSQGNITAIGRQIAYGISGLGRGETVDVANGGEIVVSGHDLAAGISMNADNGTITLTNDGSIDATASSTAMGMFASTLGDATLVNNGDINAYGSAAIGMNSGADGLATLTNTGSIQVESGALAGIAYGVLGNAGNIAFDNGGDIAAMASGIDGDAIGAVLRVSEFATEPGTVTGTNSGSITATTAVGGTRATGVFAFAGEIGFSNGGTIGAVSENNAYGVQMMSEGGNIAIANAGSITADANRATGVRVDHAGIAILSGDGDVTATGGEMATGIALFGDHVGIQMDGTVMGAAIDAGYGVIGVGVDSVDFRNNGQIDGGASADDGFAAGAILDAASITALNTGDIGATAQGTLGSAIAMIAHGGAFDFTNDGTLTAHAGDQAFGAQLIAEGTASLVNHGDINAMSANTAFGVMASGSELGVVNDGNITALGDAFAIGMSLRGNNVSFGGAGTILATADGSAHGLFASATDALAFHNDGDLRATAEGEHGSATGALIGADVTLDADNAGTIEAMATGLYGQAIALVAYGDGTVTVTNSGDLYALATQGAAIGAIVSGSGDIAIDNSGTISAHAAGETIGLRVDGEGAATIANSGTIAGSIAIEGGDAIQDIRNSGTITGTFDLGGGDDLFSNAEGGTWLLRGNESDFGDGDDAIVNAGTIVLENATIGLGANGEAGNSFTNTGMLIVDGDSHIDMGTGALIAAASGGASHAPIDVLNPLAFENNGTISFIDGAPDDMLTIAGDFAGEGAINVDVSLLNGTSDMLYIDGNIVSSSVQTLNVALLDMITETDGIDIPVVAVRGESAAGNVVPGSFNLGTVKWSPSNFIDLDLSINQHLDASNGNVDMFSISVVAGGVNDTGTLAASIASGAHSLMGAQVGTFRQRMGVFSQLGDSDKGAWVRVFGDKGTIDPDVTLDNLPQGGAFKFDQTNSGIEAGVNALVTDGWYVGASIGSSQGKQDLVDGFGRDDIDATTLGGYLTWVGAQGYADISYRFMDFDAEMTSAAGVQEVGGNAGAFNVEAGWNAWTSAGGMQLVPQVQYTRTTVDVDTVHGEFTDLVADGGTSSRARVGLELQQTFKSGDTTWTPYGVLSAVREMQGEQRFTIGDVFTGHTSTKGTSAQVEFGVNARIGRADIWGGLNWTDGGALDSFIGGQIGVRYTW